MYWQVYLHKTGIVAEQLLIRVLKRAKEISGEQQVVACSEPLRFFMNSRIEREDFNSIILDTFAKLDDVDIWAAIKNWTNHSDFVLSQLCNMLVNRRLLKVKLKNKPIEKTRFEKYFSEFKQKYKLSDYETSYFVFTGEIENRAYDSNHQNISILKKNGKLIDVAKASDQLNSKALSKTVTKYYICYPKENSSLVLSVPSKV